MKKIVLALALTVAMFSAPVTAVAAGGKIGVINMQQALNDTNEGKQVLEKMKAELQRENDIIAKKQEELKKMSDEITQQGFMLTPETRAKKEDTFRKLTKDFERYREDRRNELLEKQRRAVEKIYAGLMEALQEYAKKEKFDLILEGGQQTPGVPGAVTYYDSSIDITPAIIKLYNKK